MPLRRAHLVPLALASTLAAQESDLPGPGLPLRLPDLDLRGIEARGEATIEAIASDGPLASGALARLLLDLDYDALVRARGLAAELDFRSYRGGAPASRAAQRGRSGVLQEEDVDTIAVAALRVDGDGVGLRLGVLEASATFAALEHGGAAFFAAAGTSPALVGLPSFADSAAGAELGFEADDCYCAFGAYRTLTPGSLAAVPAEAALAAAIPPEDAMPDGSPSHPIFLIGEAGLRGERSRLALGACRTDDRFERPGGGERRGLGAGYVLAEHHLWTTGDDGRGLHVHGLTAANDGVVGEPTTHLLAGLAFQGALPGRDQDVIGFVWSRLLSRGGDGGTGRCTDLELHYRAALSAKTDLQVGVLHPVERNLEDPETGTGLALRCTIRF